jgi:hypothetical protein
LALLVFSPLLTDLLPVRKTTIAKDKAQHDLRPSTDLELTYMRDAFAELQRLSKIKASTQIENSPTLDGISYSDWVYSLGRSLIFQPHSSTIEKMLFGRCYHIAALIYIHACLCDVNFESRVIEVLVDQLQKNVERLVLNDGFSKFRDLELQRNEVFWSLVVGCMASKGKPHFFWFGKALKLGYISLGLKSSLEMKRFLKGVLWDSNLELWSQSLWSQIDGITMN